MRWTPLHVGADLRRVRAALLILSAWALASGLLSVASGEPFALAAAIVAAVVFCMALLVIIG